MKGFRFRLESVLGVRRFEDERAQLERGLAERALRGAREARRLRSDAVGQAVEAWAGRLADGVPAAFARSAVAGVEALGAGLRQAEAAVGQARETLAERQQQARAARTRLRALERLRARAAAAHRREGLARTQRELDEMALLRSRRTA